MPAVVEMRKHEVAQASTCVFRDPELPSISRITKRSKKHPENAGVRKYRWCSTTGREARPALISPSRFSHRSHGENRAGQLLSQKRAREATDQGAEQTHYSASPSNGTERFARDLDGHGAELGNAKTKPLRRSDLRNEAKSSRKIKDLHVCQRRKPGNMSRRRGSIVENKATSGVPQHIRNA